MTITIDASDRTLLYEALLPASPLKKEILANADAVRSGVFAKRSAITALFVFSHVPRPTPYTTRNGTIMCQVPRESSLDTKSAKPAYARQNPPIVITVDVV